MSVATTDSLTSRDDTKVIGIATLRPTEGLQVRIVTPKKDRNAVRSVIISRVYFDRRDDRWHSCDPWIAVRHHQLGALINLLEKAEDVIADEKIAGRSAAALSLM